MKLNLYFVTYLKDRPQPSKQPILAETNKKARELALSYGYTNILSIRKYRGMY